MTTLALIVEIEEGSAEALVEDSGATECQGAVGADGEAIGDESAGLRWAIELVLTVGGNVSLATLGIEEFSVGELDQESAVAAAGNALSLLRLLAYDVWIMGYAALMDNLLGRFHASPNQWRSRQ